MLLHGYPNSGRQVSTGKHTISVCTFPYQIFKFLLLNLTGKMLAYVRYVMSWYPNVELVHGECLSVYQTFHCFNEVLHGWCSRQSNDHNKGEHRDLFTCNATKVATTWSHPCIEHTQLGKLTAREVLFTVTQQTHYTTLHLKYYTQTKIPSWGANHFRISYKK